MRDRIFEAILKHPKAVLMEDHVWEAASSLGGLVSLELVASKLQDATPIYVLTQRDLNGVEENHILDPQEVAAAIAKGKPWLADIALAKLGIGGVIEDPEDAGHKMFLASASFEAITVSVIYESNAARGRPEGLRLTLRDPKRIPKERHFPLRKEDLEAAVASGEHPLMAALRAHPEVSETLLSQDASLFSQHEADELKASAAAVDAAAKPRTRI